MRSRQLTFVFADSPQGGKEVRPLDESAGKTHLPHRAEGMPTSDLIAPAADTSRLLEQVASEPNLATALLNVARNKGAPGVDGHRLVHPVQEGRVTRLRGKPMG